jgi:hypothetical protein
VSTIRKQPKRKRGEFFSDSLVIPIAEVISDTKSLDERNNFINL